MSRHKNAQRKKHATSFRALWGAPIVLGASSLIGLVAALLEDGLWDVAGWIGLGLPILVMLWFIVRPRGAQKASAAEPKPRSAAETQAARVG